MAAETIPVRNAEQSLVELAVENWRIMRAFAHAVSKLDAGDSGRYEKQLRYFQRQIDACLESAGLKLVEIEGQSYEPGIAAAALNIADFSSADDLVVDRMIEPIVMGPHGLQKQGTVLLRRKAS